ncbi:MAG: T9SS type A sorting domain-containing protein [Bacteroidota bacterium]
MNRTIILIFIYFFTSNVHAQNLQLWGMTSEGGANRVGTIFKINGDGSGFQNVYSFDTITGCNPIGSLFLANDGKFYGMTSYGGADSVFHNGIYEPFGSGVIFCFDPSNNSYSKLYDFYGSDGRMPLTSLIQSSANGNLYGVTHNGGINNSGVLFSFNPITLDFNKIIDFGIFQSIGFCPIGSLMEANNKKLYGKTQYGGIGNGTIYCVDPLNNNYSVLYSFDFTYQVVIRGSLAQSSDFKLYGVVENGGIDTMGRIFCFDPSNNTYSNTYDFNYSNGSLPVNKMIQLSNGLFYGLQMSGNTSNSNHGAIYSFDVKNKIYTDLFNFNGSNGSGPIGSMIQASNGKLYGMTVFGGYSDKGVIYCFDYLKNTCVKLADFDSLNGTLPYGDLVELDTTKKINNQNDISISPNPSIEQYIINSYKYMIDKIEIFNSIGELIYEAQPKSYKQIINCKQTPSGIYFARIKCGDNITTKKVIVL